MDHQTFDQVSGRDISALMNPRPITIASAEHEDAASFATIAWATPVSHEPPYLVISIKSASATYQHLAASGVFGLSIIDAGHPEATTISEYCGMTTGAEVDKLAAVPHKTVEFEIGGAQRTFHFPEIALSRIICEVEDIRPVGDFHQLVTARISDARTRAGRDDRGRVSSEDTLLCVQKDDLRSI